MEISVGNNETFAVHPNNCDTGRYAGRFKTVPCSGVYTGPLQGPYKQATSGTWEHSLFRSGTKYARRMPHVTVAT